MYISSPLFFILAIFVATFPEGSDTSHKKLVLYGIIGGSGGAVVLLAVVCLFICYVRR